MARFANPIARLGAIKLKLGALIVGGVVTTTIVLLGANALGLPLWLAIALATGLGLVTLDLLATGLTGPLRQMAEQADRLAAGQPVDPVDDAASDEVGDLARAFNRMAREVAHTDRVRRDLVANVSHELRTPLSAMAAVVENLVDGVSEPTPARLRTLEEQTGRLRVLVDQLLDLSQLDAGAIRLDRHAVDPRALVAGAVDALGAAAGRVVVDIGADVAAVDVDRDRFTQVLVNLLGNALRHGPADEHVTVEVRRDVADVVVVVADTGPGISPADAERVFERFVRADEGRTAAAGGAGLGLAITRWIVALHGGTVAVERHDGPGARLRVRLPGAAVDAEGVGADARQVPVDGTNALSADGDGTVAAGATTPTTTTDGTTMSASTSSVAPPPPPPGTGHPPQDPLRLLPTPVAGLSGRGLVAVAVAGLLALLLGWEALEAGPGLGSALLLGGVGVAALVGREQRLDGFQWTAVGTALGVVAAHAWSDAAWVLVPGTLVAALVAGLGLWGPTRAGEVLRALVVGPLLAAVAPLAIVRGARSQEPARMRSVLVPTAATVLVLLVFGGLLAQGDAAFSALVDAMLPDLSLDVDVIGRVVLATVAVVASTTYLLVERAGAVATTPWQRTTRPRRDWQVPTTALVALLASALVLRSGVLLGGEELVRSTTGLTYAEYAREGFGSLLAVAALVLVVVGIVVRVAADEDRRLRDRLLGALLGLAGITVVEALLRLQLYTEAFGLTRLRVSAYVAIVFVGVVLVVVVVAGRSPVVAVALPRLVVALVGVTVLGVAVARPDAIIARQQIDSFAGTEDLDLDYLTGLSADAGRAIATLPADVLASLDPGDGDDVVAVRANRWCGDPVVDRGHERWLGLNLARAGARSATSSLDVCAPTATSPRG